MVDSKMPLRAAPFNGVDTWYQEKNLAKWSMYVDGEDPVFLGHYPGNPVLPGIYTFESLEQAVERYFLNQGKKARVSKVKSMRFIAPFFPGDVMDMEATFTNNNSIEYNVIVRIFKNGVKAVSAKLIVTLEE